MQAVFLDRDGVINENRDDHVKSWAEFEFLPGALDALVRFHQAGVRVFVVSNQAVINRGQVAWDRVDDINRRMVAEIERRGGRVEAVACCPHRPEEACVCRKPRPGLILSLANQHGVDPRDCVLVGDAVTDLDAGQAAGCGTVLVLTGRGREQLALARQMGRRHFAVAPDLGAAASLLLDSALSASSA